MVIGNATTLPEIALKNVPGIEIASINSPIHETNNTPECSEIVPGKPGAISEHSGILFVSCIGTLMVAIPIPGRFLKAIPGNIFAFPVNIV
jgi:hypothetical protein